MIFHFTNNYNIQQSSEGQDKTVCSMASYKRLEDHYKNEHKMRKYLEQMFDEFKNTTDAKSQGK